MSEGVAQKPYALPIAYVVDRKDCPGAHLKRDAIVQIVARAIETVLRIVSGFPPPTFHPSVLSGERACPEGILTDKLPHDWGTVKEQERSAMIRNGNRYIYASGLRVWTPYGA